MSLESASSSHHSSHRHGDHPMTTQPSTGAAAGQRSQQHYPSGAHNNAHGQAHYRSKPLNCSYHGNDYHSSADCDVLKRRSATTATATPPSHVNQQPDQPRRPNAVILTSSSSSKPTAFAAKSPQTPRDECSRCGMKGHWSRNCPNRQQPSLSYTSISPIFQLTFRAFRTRPRSI